MVLMAYAVASGHPPPLVRYLPDGGQLRNRE
jgi:hypothetical protein